MKLIGYIRVSTKAQTERYGPEVQEKEIRAWARSHGYRIVRFERDLGHSGTHGVADALQDDDRPVRAGLSLAIAAVEAGKVDGIVVHEMTRLARSMMWQEIVIDQVTRKGGKVLSVRSNDEGLDEPTRALLRQVLGAIAQFDHAMIVARLQAGKQVKRAHGGYAGGAPRYGLLANLASHELDPHKSERNVTARIRKMHGAGVSIRRICETLNAEGVPAKRGGRWHPTTVQRVLGRAA